MKNWQKEDAVRLKALYNAISESTLEEFGSEYGIGSHGMVWQLLNGRRALTIEHAFAFAKGLNVKIDEFSPTIADKVRAYYQWVTPCPDDFDNLTSSEKAKLQGFIKKLLNDDEDSQN